MNDEKGKREKTGNAVLVLRRSLFGAQKREEQKELARMEMKPKRYKESRG
jgi:hypothetical protein